MPYWRGGKSLNELDADAIIFLSMIKKKPGKPSRNFLQSMICSFMVLERMQRRPQKELKTPIAGTPVLSYIFYPFGFILVSSAN